MIKDSNSLGVSLDNLVAISGRGVDDVLLEVTGNGDLAQWNLGNAIACNDPGRNKVLDQAWVAYPFRERDAGPRVA